VRYASYANRYKTFEMKKTTLIILAIFLISNVHSQPRNEPLIEKVLSNLGIEKKDCFNHLLQTKIIPYSENETIVVIPKISEIDNEIGYVILDEYLLIVNSLSGEIKSKYIKEREWTSDAIMLRNIKIDTAPYWVNENIRAFGIRVNYEGSSNANPYGSEVLSLFYKKNDEIINVLNNFLVENSNGEWDTNCNGYFENHKKILIMSKNKSNNFFDIIINDNITKTTREEVDGDCKVINIEKGKETTLLKYIDGKYKKNVL